MKLGNLLSAAIVLTITACAGKAEKDPQYVAAEKCADLVITKSKALAEKGISGNYVMRGVPGDNVWGSYCKNELFPKRIWGC